MTLKEIISIMNVYDLGIASKTIYDLLPEKKVDMLNIETDPLIAKYGDYTVDKITNVGNLGITIWVK